MILRNIESFVHKTFDLFVQCDVHHNRVAKLKRNIAHSWSIHCPPCNKSVSQVVLATNFALPERKGNLGLKGVNNLFSTIIVYIKVSGFYDDLKTF